MDWTWLKESIHSTNLWLADIDAQGVYHFPEWNEHFRADVGQVKTAEISVKNLKHYLIELNNSSTKHDDKLGMIFKSFATLQSSLHKSIQIVTKRVDKIEASKLGGTETVTGLPDQLIFERKLKEL